MTPCSGRRCARPITAGRTGLDRRAAAAPHPGERIYTFWKYFRNAFARDDGLRIDHLLMSPSLAGRLVAAGFDRDGRAREHSERSCARLDSKLPMQTPAHGNGRGAGKANAFSYASRA
jgi:hypothetical protein